MTDYRELAAEELLPEYAGLSDAQKVAAIRAKAVALRLDVEAQDIRDALRNAGVWGRLVLVSRIPPSASALASPTAQDGVVGRAIELVAAATDGIRLSRAGFRTRWQALLDALVTDGLIGGPLRTAVLGLMTASVTRAVELGFADLTVEELRAARKVVIDG